MFNKLKRKLGIYIGNKNENSPIVYLITKLNLILFHFEEREHFISCGQEDKEHTYYIIRPRSVNEGLISSYFYVMRETNIALKNNYIPIVDFKNYPCQYRVNYEVNGTYNAWEYFFKQPTHINLDDIKNKRNVLLNGWKWTKVYPALSLDSEFVNNATIKEECKYLLPVNKVIEKAVEEKYETLIKGKNILGVFIRGTDYVALKPKGHCVQPNIEDVIKKINEFLSLYSIEKVFVVTEDYNYFQKIRDDVKAEVFSSDTSFVKNYDGKNYVSESFENDAYVRGRDYLIRLLLLNKCDYLVSSYAAGSVFSYLHRDKEFKAEYWFDLGKY